MMKACARFLTLTPCRAATPLATGYGAWESTKRVAWRDWRGCIAVFSAACCGVMSALTIRSTSTRRRLLRKNARRRLRIRASGATCRWSATSPNSALWRVTSSARATPPRRRATSNSCRPARAICPRARRSQWCVLTVRPIRRRSSMIARRAARFLRLAPIRLRR